MVVRGLLPRRKLEQEGDMEIRNDLRHPDTGVGTRGNFKTIFKRSLSSLVQW